MAMAMRLAGAATLLAAVAACSPQGGMDLTQLDPDLRRWSGTGLDTAGAASVAAPRPSPDQRGIITYPGYQVVIAAPGDTVATIAGRLGLNAAELASYNAIAPSAALNSGAVVALPRRVAGGAAAPAGVIRSGTGQVSDPFAGQGMRMPVIPPASGASAPTATRSTAPQPTATQPASSQPRQHVVAAGETAWSIARKYDVSVTDLASWNGLPGNMSVRTGQRLLIPVGGQKAVTSAVLTAPGTGSPTPRPPSAAEPLPEEKTQPANKPATTTAGLDLGKTRTAASGAGPFRMPAQGAIIRPYSKGKNDGIDIAAAPGSTVSAAGKGTVAAITRDVDQVPIIVIRHDGNLMTVYAGLDQVSVAKGQTVSGGSPLGKARGQGVVHFEVRNGFESVDPEKYLN
ncbi:LysM peptidoglycan-binding domain-containing protein [Paracoccus ravus]|uniref:LysM peptidoglycan-binding domain-containing protein n=1 Tax=Paracoccus ravus TaxID=2447760 RepID=UPI00106EAB32|nr:LysM peptidoglycan-binding domain-containing protein [Paracoccus ravus]